MNLLRFTRLSLNIKQKDLAKRAQVNIIYLIGIERGRINPRPDELARLGEALGVKPELLLKEARLNPELIEVGA